MLKSDYSDSKININIIKSELGKQWNKAEKDKSGELDYQKIISDRGAVPVRLVIANPKITQSTWIPALTQRWDFESTAVNLKGIKLHDFWHIMPLKCDNRQSVQDFCLWNTYTIVLIHKNKPEIKDGFASIYSRPPVKTMLQVQMTINKCCRREGSRKGINPNWNPYSKTTTSE